MERWLFGLEIVLMAAPALLLYRARIRANPHAVYTCVVMFLLGFVAHRLNVAVTGMERSSGVAYMPKWSEIAITLALIALGFAIFRLAAHHLPLFVEEHEAEAPRVRLKPRVQASFAPAQGD
jgi:Ni/Fe-hydrogenase subunit HybB-like protein